MYLGLGSIAKGFVVSQVYVNRNEEWDYCFPGKHYKRAVLSELLSWNEFCFLGLLF